MRDPDIVALLAAGDPRGLEAAYAAYADRIHDYARWMLRSVSVDAAADVTQDTFLIALAKAGDLRDPERLRPWLYAIARNECLRVQRASRRTTALPDEDLDAGEGDVSSGVTASALRELVHAAAAGLSPRDREVFELGMRHDLSGQEVAAALGVSDNAAHAMLSRVRSQFETALGALVVARSGRGACEELNGLLSGWDGTYQPLWRKRIARHVASCDACQSVQRREMSPAALLSIMPIVAVPAAARPDWLDDLRLVSGTTSGATVSAASAASAAPVVPDELLARGRELARRAGPWKPDGFPGEVPRQRRAFGAWWAVAAVLAILGGFAGLRVLLLEPADETVLEPVEPRTSSSSAPFSPYSLEATPILRPRPSTSAPSPTATLTTALPTLLPTTTAPVASPRPTTRSPKPKPTTSSAAPVPVGRLEVPTAMRISRSVGYGSFRIRAVGGSVSWSAAAELGSGAQLTPAAGVLAAEQSMVIRVDIARITPTKFLINVTPGGHTVSVTVY